MTLFNFAKRHNSAPVARERLQILLEYDRSIITQKDLVVVLRGEILAVVARHILFEPGKVQVRVDRGADISKLEVDIEFPNTGRTATACA
jgi:cell division topological specificity factor